MLTILFLILLVFLYAKYGIFYAIGSAVYARDNNFKKSVNKTPYFIPPENSWLSVKDEFYELVQAIKALEISDIFLEFFDVVHAFIKYLLVTYTPFEFYSHWICWLFVFILVLPIGIKLGTRFKKYGCIRNHSRINNCHICCRNNNK